MLSGNPAFADSYFKPARTEYIDFNLGALAGSSNGASNIAGLNLCLFMIRSHWQCLPMDLTDNEFVQKILISIALSNVSKDIDMIA